MGATLAVVAAVAGVVNLLMSPVAVVVGWGLLKLKGWARIVVFVFAGLETLGTLFGLAGGWAHYFGPFAMLGNLARVLLVGRLAIAGWIVWYLLQPNVKAAFDRGQKITA